MIIFGSRNAHVATTPVRLISCPSCAKENSMLMSVYRNHFHVFWIPVFPLYKSAYAQCSHCKYTMTQKEMPENLKGRAREAKQNSKGPLWQFSGLLLFTVLVIAILISDTKSKEQQISYLAAPQIGDVYKYKAGPKRYTTLRVEAMQNDSIFLSPNAWETDKSSAIYKIDKDSSYLDEIYGFTKIEIDSMYKHGEIFGINR